MNFRQLCWCTIATIILVSLWYQRNRNNDLASSFQQVINSDNITAILAVVNTSYWQRHAQALREPERARFLIVRRNHGAGWGNSLSSVITAFAVALLTERTLILDWSNTRGEQSWGNFFTSPVLLDLREIKRAYNLSTTSAVKLYRQGHKLANANEKIFNLNLITLGSVNLLAIKEQHVIITEYYSSADWLLPLLYLNQYHNITVAKWFTYGRIFQQLASILLRPADVVVALVRPFQFPANVAHCIGIQIRRRRDNIPLTKYLNVAKIIARERGYHTGNTIIHISADQPDARAEAVNLFAQGLGFKISVLPAENVFNPKGKEGLNRDNTIGLQYGLVEMQLLARCEEILVAHGSSFGYIAAAWYGTKATFITMTGHFKALVSDPCMWSANLLRRTYSTVPEQYPHELFEHYLQCHPPI